uniref:Uncharacterized protein n=1 Tax=Panagrolaimus davidi TaxID=227884 RepID=A0A914PWX8_9BILA
MTSRQYTDMSTINEENEENKIPFKDETPRAKYVPPKKSRISDSPLTTLQQNFIAQSSKITENNSSILGTSRASFLEAEMQAYSETNCTCGKFQQAMTEYKELGSNITSFSFPGASQVSFLQEEMHIYAEDKCKCARFQAIIKEYNNLLKSFKTSNGDSMNSTSLTASNCQEEVTKLKQELEKAKVEMDNVNQKLKDVEKFSQQQQTDIGLLKVDKDFIQNLFNLNEAEHAAFKISSEKTINQLREDIDKLNAQVSKTAEEKEIANKAAENLQKEVQNLQEALKDAKKSADSNAKLKTEKTINQLQAEIAQLNAQNSKIAENSQKKIQDLQEALKDAKKNEDSKNAELEKQNIILKEKLQIFEQKEAESKKAYNKLKSEMEVLGNEKVDLQYSCAAKDVENKNVIDQNNANLQEVNEELENLRTTLNHGKQKYLNLKEQLKQKCKEIEAFKVSENGNNAKNKEIDSLKKKVNHYKKKNAESEEVCNYLRADIEVLKTKKVELDDEIYGIKNTIEKEKAEFRNQISQLNVDVEGYKASVENAQTKIKNLQAAIENERNSLNAQIADIQQQKYNEIEAFKAAHGDSRALKEQLQSYKQKLAEAEKAMKKVENDIKFLKSEKAYLEKKLSLKKSEIEELRLNPVSSENGGIDRNEIKAIQAENAKLKQKLNKIYRDFEEADIAKEESDHLLLELKKKLDNINTDTQHIRPTFDIPKDLAHLFSTNFTNQPPAEKQPHSKVSKTENRQKSQSSKKKDYNAEDSCTTQ